MTEPSKDKTKLQCNVTISFLRLLTEILVKVCLQEQKLLRDSCITKSYPHHFWQIPKAWQLGAQCIAYRQLNRCDRVLSTWLSSSKPVLGCSAGLRVFLSAWVFWERFSPFCIVYSWMGRGYGILSVSGISWCFFWVVALCLKKLSCGKECFSLVELLQNRSGVHS